MKRLKKLKLLKELYSYKFVGLNYLDDIENFTTKNTKNSNTLPFSMDSLKQITLDCHLCQLSKTRTKVVFGEGSLNASVLFVGEGPGANEDNTGRPFVGRAGELLTKIIENVLELKREDIYISNIVKCRPPNNRVPNDEEVSECLPYLFKQIEIIKPSIIVTLGATAYQNLTGDKTSISRIRGETVNFKGMKIVPTFHPSYLLRNPSAKKFVFFDMLKVKKMLEN